MELKPNHTLQGGKYRIVEKIGRGGFGITYRATWQTTVSGSMGEMQTQIPVAIKEFFFEDYCTREPGGATVTITSATGRDMFDRFKGKLIKEAHLLSRLHHPNIVRVLDVFEENNTAYIAMAFVDGESLRDKLRRAGRLSEEKTLRYAGQLCDALTEIHDARILHLDIKPGNILIDADDNVQLIDFGISKQYDDTHKETSTTPVGISKGFAPPEQYGGVKDFQPTADIYAVGATLYNMLTGKVPPESMRLVDEELPPVRDIAPEVSVGVERAVERAMSIRRADRHPSAAELKRELLNSDSGFVAAPDETRREPLRGNHAPGGRAGNDDTVRTDPPTAPPITPDPKGDGGDGNGKNRRLIWITVGCGIIALVVVLLLVLRAVIGHEQYQRGRNQYNAENYTEAFWWFLKSGRNGDINGTYYLATMYEYGFGVEKNLTEATRWYRKAAKKGWREETEEAMIRINPVSTLQGTAQSSNVPRHPAEPEMVFVEGGTFWMGSTGEGAYEDEAPIHQVTLSSFHIAKYEVTQGQWRALMGTTVIQQRDKVNSTYGLAGIDDNYPMYYVNWDEAQEFVRRLNVATGKRYALPTEAQWEFAARGGNRSQGYTYSGGNDIDGVAWYTSNSGSTTHMVGTKSPNELGIYDMSGNVWEWCADWYGVYPAGAQTNPTGSLAGSNRVARGGSWNSDARRCRSAFRNSYTPGNRSDYLGFRLVVLP